jgi:Na+-transporting NADH:ubiquinone oxidoreductase subunit A
MAASIRIKNGLNVPVKGEPEQSVYPGPGIRQVALCGPDYPGLKPRLLISEGDAVGLGQPLFCDKRDPAVSYASPGKGKVIAINRGARRVLESVVVRLEENQVKDECFDPLSADQIGALDGDEAAERLLQSGLWTALRTRPFSRVPFSGSRPRSIFVTAVDTRPLAANPAVVIEKNAAGFATGLQVLSSLTNGNIFLCTAPDSGIAIAGIDRLRHAEFSGPHPAGLPGTHIHFLDPVGAERTAWHIGYQDVIAIGALFSSGTIETGRIIALGGDGVTQPRLLKTRLGASIEELLAGSLLDVRECREVSGSVLDGRAAQGNLAFMGRYHQQVSVIHEGGDRSLLGWTGLFPRRYTAAPALLRKTGQKQKRNFTTSQNGRFTGMIPLRAFDKVVPLDILPAPLFRALMVKDTDQAQALGCLELDEEDLALCSFVCPAKYDYGAVLRINLDQIEKEG